MIHDWKALRYYNDKGDIRIYIDLKEMEPRAAKEAEENAGSRKRKCLLFSRSKCFSATLANT